MKTKCPHCQKVLSVPEIYEEKQIKCISCKKTLVAKAIVKKMDYQPKKQSPSLDLNLGRWIGRIAIFTVLVLVMQFSLEFGILLFLVVCAFYYLCHLGKKAHRLQALVIEMRNIYAKARKGEITKSAADKFFNLADKATLMMLKEEEKTVASFRNEIQNMSNQISLILTLRTPTASVGEEIDILATLRQEGMISDAEFQGFSERFKLTTGEKASDIIKSISELYIQQQKGAMSKGNFNSALWSLLDKLDRKT